MVARVGDDGWLSDAMSTARGLLEASAGQQEWTTTTLTGTGGGTFGDSVVSRFRSAEGTAVVKIVKRNAAAPDNPLSWRRELDLYRSEWLRDTMPSGLHLPECLGAAMTDDASVIVVADVPFDDPSARDVDWYRDLAAELARLNGTVLDARSVPPWASRGFVEYETAGAAAAIPDTVQNRATEIADVIDAWGPLLERVAPAGTRLVEALRSFPTGLHHLDAFSRNVARVGDDFVMVDWAYTGLAPIGCDAASLIAITAIMREVPGGLLGELHDAVTEGYGAGLASVGAGLPAEELDLAIDLALTLRFARFATQLHGLGNDANSVVEAATGRPLGEVAIAWAALAEHLAPSAERSLASVGG